MIRLLLADDQELIRTALAVMLALEEDFEVVASVGRGDQVAAAAMQHHPDVALLDIEMPGLDGLARGPHVPAAPARLAGESRRHPRRPSRILNATPRAWSRRPAIEISLANKRYPPTSVPASVRPGRVGPRGRRRSALRDHPIGR